MNKRILIILATLLLQACAVNYVPREYAVRNGAINSLKVVGAVNVTNNQRSTIPVVVYTRNGGELYTNMQAVTDTMVQVARSELNKGNQFENNATTSKSIELSVLSLSSQYKLTHWEGMLHFQAKLGNGVIIEKTISYTTPSGSSSNATLANLNGSITEGVVSLFNDQRFRLYLEQ